MSDNERVKVRATEIRVGDLIEVEDHFPSGDIAINRGVVLRTHPGEPGAVETAESWLSAEILPYRDRTFYVLPKPPIAEPEGLGAVVEDSEADLWVHTYSGWVLSSDEPAPWSTVLRYAPLTVKSDGYNE